MLDLLRKHCGHNPDIGHGVLLPHETDSDRPMLFPVAFEDANERIPKLLTSF